MYETKPIDDLFVDAKLTPLTKEVAACTLRTAYKNIMGEYPSLDSLAILYAQTALESGNFQKGLWNANWGNIKRLSGIKYTSFKCSEVLDGKNQWFYPYHPQTFFSAWDTVEEGAVAYLSFLKNRKRYAAAWQEMVAGNTIKYVVCLKQSGYFTADLTQYLKGVVSLTEEFKRKFKDYDWPEEVDVDVSELSKQEQVTIPDIAMIPPPIPERVIVDDTVMIKPIETSSNIFSVIVEFIGKLFGGK